MSRSIKRQYLTCVKCGAPLPPTRKKFCSDACAREGCRKQRRIKNENRADADPFAEYFNYIREKPNVSYGKWMANKYLGGK